MTQIRNILAQRTDLSTFLVHLTRDHGGKSAKENLISILKHAIPTIEARNPFGFAKGNFVEGSPEWNSQCCVCFTETPLEYIKLLIGPIEGRTVEMKPYGVALTKKQGRKRSLNPVWYVDQTPGQQAQWILQKSVNALIDEASKGTWTNSPISTIAPFVESMGTWQGTKKEFWWEREWRCVGSYTLVDHFLLLCPEEDIKEFRELTKNFFCSPSILAPEWSMERMIAALAGFPADDVEIL